MRFDEWIASAYTFVTDQFKDAAREGWNAAIEAAAKTADEWDLPQANEPISLGIRDNIMRLHTKDDPQKPEEGG